MVVHDLLKLLVLSLNGSEHVTKHVHVEDVFRRVGGEEGTLILDSGDNLQEPANRLLVADHGIEHGKFGTHFCGEAMYLLQEVVEFHPGVIGYFLWA